MSRAKTARKRKSKAQTHRKPKIYTSVSETDYNNSINNNSARNIEELQQDPALQRQYSLERHYGRDRYERALEKYNSFPPNSFHIQIMGSESRRVGTRVIRGKKMRVMDLVNLLRENRHRNFRPLKLLYKGETEEEDYCFKIVYSQSFTENQEVELEDMQMQQGVFNVWELDPLEYSLQSTVVNFGEEPEFYFYNPADRNKFLTFLINLPHLREKNRREQEALVTGPAKYKALQHTGINRIMSRFTGRTGREVPEDMERLIKGFI